MPDRFLRNARWLPFLNGDEQLLFASVPGFWKSFLPLVLEALIYAAIIFPFLAAIAVGTGFFEPTDVVILSGDCFFLTLCLLLITRKRHAFVVTNRRVLSKLIGSVNLTDIERVSAMRHDLMLYRRGAAPMRFRFVNDTAKAQAAIIEATHD
ncbi:MAG: hypothetical protein GY947_15390 [Rhodobacteraceae bacterium]|nr:hypothetical protein [Paracoccaceae bacterium]